MATTAATLEAAEAGRADRRANRTTAAPIIDLEGVGHDGSRPRRRRAIAGPEHSVRWTPVRSLHWPLAAARRARRRGRRHRRRRARRRACCANRTVRPATADATRALQNSVAQLSGELTTLKAGSPTRSATPARQFGKLAERLDRSEKAQAEPAGQARQDPGQHRPARTAPAAGRRCAARRTSPARLTAEGANRSRRSPKAGGCATSMPAAPWCESRNGTLFEVGAGIEPAGARQGRDASSARTASIVVVTAKRHHRRAVRAAPHADTIRRHRYRY